MLDRNITYLDDVRFSGKSHPMTQISEVTTNASEKDYTCISPSVHPNVHVITCSSFMWLEIHASTEAFSWFLYVRTYVHTPLVTASHNLFPRGQKDVLTSFWIHGN
jgi:hypothetical protein